MDFPFGFTPPMFMPPAMTRGSVAPPPMSSFAPFGDMPTAAQREEFSLAFLDNEKKQIAAMREYLQECIKSLDATVGVIDKEVAKINEARKQRRKEEAAAEPETRSKR